jgi:hypothetical protein
LAMILAQNFFDFWQEVPAVIAALATLVGVLIGVPMVACGLYRAGRAIAIVTLAVGLFVAIGLLFWDATSAVVATELSTLWTGIVLVFYSLIASARMPEKESAAIQATAEGAKGTLPALPVLEYARRGGFSQGKATPPAAVKNWAGLASAALGFLGIFPFIPGLAAIVLGCIGWSKGRNPAIGDRFFAGIGLLLGSASVIVWCVIPTFLMYQNSQIPAAATVSQQFITDLSQQDYNAAAHLCDGLSAAQIKVAVLKFGPRVPAGSAYVYQSEMMLNPFGRIDTYGDIPFNNSIRAGSLKSCSTKSWGRIRWWASPSIRIRDPRRKIFHGEAREEMQRRV